MEREVSFYGDEETGTAPQDLYSREDAAGYIKEAGYVFDRCRSVIEGPERKGRR